MREKLNEVKQWLRTIPKKELAIPNLEEAIKDIDTKLENPPTSLVGGISQYGERMAADSEPLTKGERYLEWKEEQLNRREMLFEKLTKYKREVRQYYDTLEGLDRICGSRAKEIIHAKFYRGIKEDYTIYNMIVFCSKRTFYRELNQGLELIYKILPDLFL